MKGDKITMDQISRIKELLNVEEIKEMKSFQRKWFDEGRAIGYAEGKILGAKAAIAETMLKAGEKIEKIILYTGLTKDEIENLTKNENS